MISLVQDAANVAHPAEIFVQVYDNAVTHQDPAIARLQKPIELIMFLK